MKCPLRIMCRGLVLQDPQVSSSMKTMHWWIQSWKDYQELEPDGESSFLRGMTLKGTSCLLLSFSLTASWSLGGGQPSYMAPSAIMLLHQYQPKSKGTNGLSLKFLTPLAKKTCPPRVTFFRYVTATESELAMTRKAIPDMIPIWNL